MRIEKAGYAFDVKRERTQAYYRKQEPCDCPLCRNFYAQAEARFPKLKSFLEAFGADILRPDELFPCENTKEGAVEYLGAVYTVCGSVAASDGQGFELPDTQRLHITADTQWVPNQQETEEYFVLSVNSVIRLPWVLEEPLEEPKKFGLLDKIKGFFGK